MGVMHRFDAGQFLKSQNSWQAASKDLHIILKLPHTFRGLAFTFLQLVYGTCNLRLKRAVVPQLLCLCSHHVNCSLKCQNIGIAGHGLRGCSWSLATWAGFFAGHCLGTASNGSSSVKMCMVSQRLKYSSCSQRHPSIGLPRKNSLGPAFKACTSF